MMNRLLTLALEDCDAEQLLADTCNELIGHGIPIRRSHVSFRTLHPLFSAQSLTWYAGHGVEKNDYRHQEGETAEFLKSPMYFMISRGLDEIRRRLTDDNARSEFPVFSDLLDAGMTDYAAFTVRFGRSQSDDAPDGVITSWATNEPDGFSDSQINVLRQMQQGFAVAAKLSMQREISRNIAVTYLGKDAGQQVLSGRIRRGDVETIHAVIWYSDMRDSTEIAERLGGREFLDQVNEYFSCTAGAVAEHGGEILRFVGDAVLAIFPIRDHLGTQAACAQAVQAARSAESKLRERNHRRSQAGLHPIRYGLSLHIGDVLFGNIGIPERLEFSVIGRSANEAARMEEITKTSGHTTVASDRFVQSSPGEWKPLGAFQFKGIAAPITVHALIDDTMQNGEAGNAVSTKDASGNNEKTNA